MTAAGIRSRLAWRVRPNPGSRTGLLATLAVLPLLAAATVACEPTLRQERGIVVRVDSPVLGTVDGFELRTDGGDTLEFDTGRLPFDRGFPAAHLAEHQAMAAPVRVTYRVEDGRNLVVRLEDAADQ